MTLGALLIALAIACVKLIWWQSLDALLLVALAATVPAILSREIAAKARADWISVALTSLVPGFIYVLGWDRPTKGNAREQTELQGLILRDLAGWISLHSEPGTVSMLAPPSASTALCYYGAFRAPRFVVRGKSRRYCGGGSHHEYAWPPRGRGSRESPQNHAHCPAILGFVFR